MFSPGINLESPFLQFSEVILVWNGTQSARFGWFVWSLVLSYHYSLEIPWNGERKYIKKKNIVSHWHVLFQSNNTVFQLLLLYHIVSLLLHGKKPSSNKNPLTYQYTVLQHTQNSLWIATLLSLQKQTDYIYKLNFSLQSPSYWWPMVKILS